VRTAVLDLLSPGALEKIRELHPGPFRLVTSDMAPKTIGIKVTDEARSLELVRMAMQVAEGTLVRGGALVAKAFMGGDFGELKKEFAGRFLSVHVVRPEATREHSYEVYLVGKGFLGAPPRVPEKAPVAAPPPALSTRLVRAEAKSKKAPARPRVAASSRAVGRARRRRNPIR
jgi:23S rRNA (uridine2552-2'-O)-methyltransferase